jgi:hypothetical protein
MPLKLFNVFVVLSLSGALYGQITPYALDSILLDDIDRELENYKSYFLTDISSFWNDDHKIIGVGQNKNGKTRRIKIKLVKDTTRGFYGMAIAKIKYSHFKSEQYHEYLDKISALSKEKIEDETLPQMKEGEIRRKPSSDGPTYTLIIKNTSARRYIIQLYRPDFYQKRNYLQEREVFVKVIEEFSEIQD